MPPAPRVALVTCAELPDLYAEDQLLPPALAATGVDAAPVVWDDPGVDWSSFDLVVLRSPWDYVPRHAEFLAWTRTQQRLLNPADVVAWNTDKRYLRELAAAGVPVVPTTWLEPGDAYVVPQVEHVVKPVVSANAADTARYAAGEDSRPHVQRLLDAGRAVMVQPYLSAVDVEGETALVHVDGRFSHAARKAPVLVPELAEPDDVAVTPATATPEQLAVAEAALAAVPGTPDLLYARVDVVPGPDGTPVLLELELTEPSLFLDRDPQGVQRFAAAVAARVRPTAR